MLEGKLPEYESRLPLIGKYTDLAECIREYDKRFRRATRRAEVLNRGLTRKELPPGL